MQHIVEQSASEILKMYLLDPDRSQRPWTPEQAWLLIKQLAQNESVSSLPPTNSPLKKLSNSDDHSFDTVRFCFPASTNPAVNPSCVPSSKQS